MAHFRKVGVIITGIHLKIKSARYFSQLFLGPNSVGMGQNSPRLLDYDLCVKKDQGPSCSDRIPCAICSNVLLYSEGVLCD